MPVLPDVVTSSCNVNQRSRTSKRRNSSCLSKSEESLPSRVFSEESFLHPAAREEGQMRHLSLNDLRDLPSSERNQVSCPCASRVGIHCASCRRRIRAPCDRCTRKIGKSLRKIADAFSENQQVKNHSFK